MKFPIVYEYRYSGKIKTLIIMKSSKKQEAYNYVDWRSKYVKSEGEPLAILLESKNPEVLFPMRGAENSFTPKPSLKVIESASWDQIKPLLEEVKAIGIFENGK